MFLSPNHNSENKKITMTVACSLQFLMPSVLLENKSFVTRIIILWYHWSWQTGWCSLVLMGACLNLISGRKQCFSALLHFSQLQSSTIGWTVGQIMCCMKHYGFWLHHTTSFHEAWGGCYQASLVHYPPSSHLVRRIQNSSPFTV